ncbi:MAG: GTP-binding protein [Lachnospiraceae bacterium]|nr:GTP-binding protein [Lachnospiraceae bacterium]
MTKIDIFSGFLGAGKTTLIKKLLKEALADTKVVLIENEFGEIGIDGGFLKEAGIEIKEMNSGCICCSLVGDFGASLKEVLTTYTPERVLIEPSGVGKLSDVIKAVEDVAADIDVQVNSAVAVVDASKCKMYIKNFGEFFCNQIAHAGTIILSRTAGMSQDKLEKCIEMIREHNAQATIITTPWDELAGEDILNTIEGADKLEHMMEELLEEEHHHHDHDEECCHGHHHHDHDEECCHGHHHDHDEECCRGHHHHDHDEECCHGHHHDHDEECHHGHHHDHDEECHHDHHHEHEHHHHDHGEECTCGCHDHHREHDHDGHHHHHHADEVFTSWGKETPVVYTQEKITDILTALDGGEYGMVLRAKGMVPAQDGTWIYFDYVPEERDIRAGKAQVTGKLCVIGSKLDEAKLEELFGVK